MLRRRQDYPNLYISNKSIMKDLKRFVRFLSRSDTLYHIAPGTDMPSGPVPKKMKIKQRQRFFTLHSSLNLLYLCVEIN